MSALREKIARLISTQGPMDISRYMTMAMSDPQYGYYNTAEPFGRSGDFITAPEVSQMFGEIIAVWAIATWQGLGSPGPFALCEAGPGRGTLMDDILRTGAKLAPQWLACARPVLVETSPRLVKIQQEKLSSHPVKPQWIENLDGLPQIPLLLIANELFDVLPIRQYAACKGGFRERMVSLSREGSLCFSLGPVEAAPAPAKKMPSGTIVEISPARLALARQISRHLARHKGAALIIDYGALEPGVGDTLQAVSKHGFCGPLKNPGGCDLTSHVDFAALAEAAHSAGCQTAAMTQGAFLLKLGLLERADRLGAGGNEALRRQVTADTERLAAPDQMGELFKILCIASPPANAPPFHWEPAPTQQSPEQRHPEQQH